MTKLKNRKRKIALLTFATASLLALGAGSVLGLRAWLRQEIASFEASLTEEGWELSVTQLSLKGATVSVRSPSRKIEVPSFPVRLYYGFVPLRVEVGANPTMAALPSVQLTQLKSHARLVLPVFSEVTYRAEVEAQRERVPQHLLVKGNLRKTQGEWKVGSVPVSFFWDWENSRGEIAPFSFSGVTLRSAIEVQKGEASIEAQCEAPCLSFEEARVGRLDLQAKDSSGIWKLVLRGQGVTWEGGESLHLPAAGFDVEALGPVKGRWNWSLKGKSSDKVASILGKGVYAESSGFSGVFTPLIEADAETLGTWVPAIKESLTLGNFSLNGKVTVTCRPDKPCVTKAGSALTSSAFQYGKASVLGASLKLDGSTQGTGHLTVEKVGDRPGLTDVQLPFQWNDSRLVVASVAAKFGQGTVSVAGFTYDWKKPKFVARLALEGLSLSELAYTANLKSIEAEGRLSGRGSFFVDGKTWHPGDLLLYSLAPGRIAYSDDSTPFRGKEINYLDEFEAILAQGQQALAMKALENFQYEDLRLEGHRDEAGEWSAKLSLRGKNPGLAKGQPFELNLPVTGDLTSLLKDNLWNQFMENSENDS